MEAVFDALGDRTRRRILEVLAGSEQPAGAVVETLQASQSISQPAVSQHLKILRDAGLVAVRAEGTRRFYSVDQHVLHAARAWLAHIADPAELFTQPLDALETEIARGKRRSKRTASSDQRGSAAAG